MSGGTKLVRLLALGISGTQLETGVAGMVHFEPGVFFGTFAVQRPATTAFAQANCLIVRTSLKAKTAFVSIFQNFGVQHLDGQDFRSAAGRGIMPSGRAPLTPPR